MSHTSERSFFLHEIEENLWETWSNFGRGPGCSLHSRNDLIWFETPIPLIPLNGVLKFQVRNNPDQLINEIVNHFRGQNVQFMWIIHPSSEPHDLRKRLLGQGLKDVEPIYGMARTLEDLEDLSPVPDDIDIRKVQGDKDSSAFYQFAAWRWSVPEEYRIQHELITKCFRFGKPNTKAHMWQAWRGGQPVAKAGMCLSQNSAGIYAVFTKPEGRRLGLARALTLMALHEARSLGYQTAVLHSTPMAEKLYQSIGFETIAEFRLFASKEVHI
jgi:ribosomal protein S18 acetylase RimI-like enzyme